MGRAIEERLEAEPNAEDGLFLQRIGTRVAFHPGLARGPLFQRFLRVLTTADSAGATAEEPPKTTRSLLATLYELLLADPSLIHTLVQQEGGAPFRALLRRITSEINNFTAQVRVISLKLYALLNTLARANGLLLDRVPELDEQLPATLSRFIHDPHPKVRKASLDLIYYCHLSGYPLSASLYPVSVECLKDDYEYVRLGALRIVWLISKLYPLEVIEVRKHDYSDSIRLVDDAFVKVCDMVNDISMTIRTEACVLLGSYFDVQFNYLSQTLSKKIMSHLKRRPAFAKGGSKRDGGSGRSNRNIIPVAEGDMDVESDDFRILDSGACGAFVHGLEDEYREVRNAAINSICELCLQSAEFSQQAVDYLVDIFNDEIDYVRLNAITSLTKIASRYPITLDREQLQIIFGVMEDADPKIRQSIHSLVSSVLLADVPALMTTVETLSDSLLRHSDDQASIYRCLRSVGYRHRNSIDSALVEKLLKIEKHFLTREINQDDLVLTAHLALILNAAENRSAFMSILPPFIFNYIPYLHDKFPDCFPEPRRLGGAARDRATEYLTDSVLKTSIVPRARLDNITAVPRDICLRIPAVLTLVKQGQRSRAQRFIRQQIQQLRTTIAFDPSPITPAPGKLVQPFLQSLALVLNAQALVGRTSDTAAWCNLPGDLMARAYRLEHAYLGHSPQTRYALGLLRLFAHILFTFIPASKGERRDPPQLQALRAQLVQTEVPATQFNSQLYRFAQQLQLEPCGDRDCFKPVSVNITQPISNPDKPLTVLGAFPLSLTIEATLYWIHDLSAIRIRLTLPDFTNVYFQPPLIHFTPTGPLSYRLQTTVGHSLSGYSGLSTVELALVLAYPLECPEIDASLSRNSSSDQKRCLSQATSDDNDDNPSEESTVSDLAYVDLLVKPIQIFTNLVPTA
ncbi:armadillo-type protein [Dimargaris cristalligena]|uniref:Armadillo-type protein n=1 Tax=Dimargaris cristalligena TaxID=215637 RepID=A0A4P9ZMK8_9FUNG|nr:armadillo-type protein [Dimargaris cristalligena]|eukprot:RKP34355.1 armadillo-type protein [Dimargaris cristalligena]